MYDESSNNQTYFLKGFLQNSCVENSAESLSRESTKLIVVFRMNAEEAALNALKFVLEGKEGEKIVIFCDDTRAQIGEAFEAGAQNLGLKTSLIILETQPNTFRTQIPPKLEK